MGNTELQCNCNYLSVVWDMVNKGQTSDVKCTANNHNIDTKNKKQMSDDDISKINCSKFKKIKFCNDF